MTTCDICGADIPPETLKRRRKTKGNSHTCSKACETERRRRVGLFAAMSKIGKDARSQAVRLSNISHPRRKRKQ